MRRETRVRITKSQISEAPPFSHYCHMFFAFRIQQEQWLNVNLLGESRHTSTVGDASI
ncbi:hypothetical protein CDL12_10688 [Handroanthus impetiginosus]|uniref:Uncharacterized protein n=1 Tax=Handroanthus impetiginosus TaxID=429701 RepID=A0A2G9HGU8_9LAMI|nr:hypothetical protein CDL12_10688 [Handroanthus impetiginosus]